MINPYVVYCTSALLGMSGAVLWVAQGSFLTLNSTDETRGKIAGLFWGLFQVSAIVGNIGAYFVLSNFEFQSLAIAFTAIGVSGCGVMLLFRKPTTASSGGGGSTSSVSYVKLAEEAPVEAQQQTTPQDEEIVEVPISVSVFIVIAVIEGRRLTFQRSRQRHNGES